jgi:hypothetical protein
MIFNVKIVIVNKIRINMEDKKEITEIVDFIKSKEEEKEVLNKKERKINHYVSSIKATEKRMEKFEGVPHGGNFSCVCGCKKKMIKTSPNSKFKSLSGSGNCKDKHFGNKRNLVKILSEITKEQFKDIEERIPVFNKMLMEVYQENKQSILRLKQSKQKRRYP